MAKIFDKYEACKDLETGADCPDRKLGCHDICDGYKFRCEKQAKINRNRKASMKVPTAHCKMARLNFYKHQKRYRQYKK